MPEPTDPYAVQLKANVDAARKQLKSIENRLEEMRDQLEESLKAAGEEGWDQYLQGPGKDTAFGQDFQARVEEAERADAALRDAEERLTNYRRDLFAGLPGDASSGSTSTGPTDPNVDTGHYDDGHAFGWKEKPKDPDHWTQLTGGAPGAYSSPALSDPDTTSPRAPTDARGGGGQLAVRSNTDETAHTGSPARRAKSNDELVARKRELLRILDMEQVAPLPGMPRSESIAFEIQRIDEELAARANPDAHQAPPADPNDPWALRGRSVEELERRRRQLIEWCLWKPRTIGEVVTDFAPGGEPGEEDNFEPAPWHDQPVFEDESKFQAEIDAIDHWLASQPGYVSDPGQAQLDEARATMLQAKADLARLQEQAASSNTDSSVRERARAACLAAYTDMQNKSDAYYGMHKAHDELRARAKQRSAEPTLDSTETEPVATAPSQTRKPSVKVVVGVGAGIALMLIGVVVVFASGGGDSNDGAGAKAQQDAPVETGGSLADAAAVPAAPVTQRIVWGNSSRIVGTTPGAGCQVLYEWTITIRDAASAGKSAVIFRYGPDFPGDPEETFVVGGDGTFIVPVQTSTCTQTEQTVVGLISVDGKTNVSPTKEELLARNAN